MFPWNCCRTCLGVQCLNPIFRLPEYHETYTNVILTTIGVKIELNDTLPQEMCTTCISFINEMHKFRKKCEDAQKTLQNKLQHKQFYEIKIESQVFKEEKNATIDISDLLNLDNDFKCYDENITVNEYENYDVNDKPHDNNQEIEFENRMQETVEKPIEIIFKNKKNGKNVKEKVRKKIKEKKEKKDVERKEERSKEEIECEYCHKILTSKLSLRNHYKIHTGFDVVCEHCGKKFITRRLLLMHCRAKHGYEKTDKCSYCDYRASNAEQVKIHERLHTGEKPYVCKECSAGFHRKSSYLQHVAIHLPEKTVQCDQCPARFKSVTLMRIHKNRHRAPQYSFKCRVCDNSFARRRNVARHLQRIHGLPPDQEHIDRTKIA